MLNYFKVNKLFVILLTVCFFFAVTSIEPFNKVFAAESSEVSTIAGIEVDTVNKKELEKALLEKVDLWKETPVTLDTGYTILEFDTSLFIFDIKGTIKKFKTVTKKPWYLPWKKQVIVNMPLMVEIDETVINTINEENNIANEETILYMKEQIGFELASNIEVVHLDKPILDYDRIGLVVKQIPVNNSLLEILLESFNELTINQNESFSFLEFMRENDISHDSNQNSLDFIASIFYNLLLQSNYEILERHANPIKFESFTPGTEAHVLALTEKDLVFTNPNSVSGIFKFYIEGNQLKAELLSLPLDVTIDFYQMNKEQIPQRVIYRLSDKLAINTQEIVEVGEPGIKVSTFRKISEKYGSFETDELMSTDFYPPKHKVILKSSRVPEINNELPPGDLENGNNNEGDSNAPSDDTTKSEDDSNLNKDNSSNENDDNEEDLNEDNADENGNPLEYDKGGNIIKPSGK